mgnify:CR=1 FL=1
MTKAKKKVLTERQEATMKKHSEHHSKKHMNNMRKAMPDGSTFTAAHKIAKKLDKK